MPHRHRSAARAAAPGDTMTAVLIAGVLAGFVGDAASAGPPAAPPATAAETATAAVSTESSAGDAAWLDALGRSAEALVWSDEAIRHDWRLQRRPRSAAWRVLDPRDRVVCQGSRDECERVFARLERSGQAPAVRGRTVIVLHGLGEGRRSMRPLVDHLREQLDATVLAFGYASTAADIESHGRSLATVIAGLPQADDISFVGHSLGGIVVRRWMGLAAPADLARVGRVVMLGPPNQGSELARMVADVGFLAGLAEGAARDLVIDWKRVSQDLAVPPCDFGIVAGGKGDDRGYSSLLAGDDDAVVRVEETRLDGADDFLLVPVHHAAMMRHPAVQRATASFLETGRFERQEER
jgi:alpha-beta hydrolase superfamily lysophospholipase